MSRWIFLVLPLLLLAALVALFLGGGSPRVLTTGLPPIEEVAVQRAELEPGRITLHLLNDGPGEVTIAQAMVNDAYWVFSLEPSATLGRLQRAVLTLPYAWVEGEPQRIRLVSSTGVTFDTEIEVAVTTPRPDAGYLGALAFLGFAIGVVPVFLGLLWLPFLRSLKSAWFGFFLALTLGLLLFLGVDSLAEAIGLLGQTPNSLMGTGVLTIGFALAFLLISALGRRPARPAASAAPAAAGEEERGPGGRAWPSPSPSASASTTWARGWRSAGPTPPATSPSGRSWWWASWSTTSPRGWPSWPPSPARGWAWCGCSCWGCWRGRRPSPAPGSAASPTRRSGRSSSWAWAPGPSSRSSWTSRGR